MPEIRAGRTSTVKNILVDGNNLLHRIHYVFVQNRMDDPLTNNRGYPTGLIYGVLETLATWVRRIPGRGPINFFWDGAPRQRVALDPGYKADRKKSSIYSELPIKLSDGFEALTELDVITHVLGLLGVSVYHHPYFEADDLIAAFTKEFPGPHVILSSDKDFFQLVKDDVIVHRPEGGGDYKFYDPDAVLDKLGVFPNEVRLFKSLTGDISDCIPGVPRLRKKIAARLCRHKELAPLFASDLNECSKREAILIREMKDRIELNFDLVGFYDIDPLSNHLVSPDKDIDVAESILADDLGIYRLDLESFQNTSRKTVITSSPVFTIEVSDLLD